MGELTIVEQVINSLSSMPRTAADFRRRDFISLGALPFTLSARTSCIVLSLTGGPSQLDTWDPKPNAPSHIRGPYRPVKTNVPGIEISELFPRMARHADKFALLRGVYRNDAATHGEPLFDGLPEPISPAGPPDERYGLNRFGQSCLRARQLIEAGARVVTVQMFETVYDELTWDVHGARPFSPLSAYRDSVAPMFDLAYTTLLTDLHDRGLLKTTMVIASGEFGRTPYLNSIGGRDHWPHCWTMVVAGGPFAGGQVIGSSDAIGAEPKDRPIPLAEIAGVVRAGLYARLT
ncbi:MAG: DUF1501 domain-containing protein [Bryobacteraceae bacterium]|nr:DUF1501 domain-containing protein [Bryobacteraceae bacterium]